MTLIGSAEDQVHISTYVPREMRRTCANETVSSNVLSGDHRFEQKAVFRVFRDTEICHAWRDEIRRKLNEDWYTVSSFLPNNELLDHRERRVCIQLLDERAIRLTVMPMWCPMQPTCGSIDVVFEGRRERMRILQVLRIRL